MDESLRLAVISALLRSESLELATSLRPIVGTDGKKLGKRTGNALEFADYREYRPGDDLRRLDWGVMARSGQLAIKLYSEEIDPRCDIVIDQSASMACEVNKAAAALGLAALLANAAVNAGFSLTVWHCADTLKKEPQSAYPEAWENCDFSGMTSPGEGFKNFVGGFQRGGIRFVVTDLLWTNEPDFFLRSLSDGSASVVIIQLLTQNEENPRFTDRLSLIDAESGEIREITMNNATLSRYCERLSRHQDLWRRAAEKHDVKLIRISVEELYPTWDIQKLFCAGVFK
ncbi:MAG: DUF58 domain-containing protein [Victivallales bacterium]|jgi:hypothetical protein|nr:DUF58 domain-containing protein [Victivallales bacterium]